MRKHLQSRARLSSANSLKLIRLFPDLAFGLLFHRFQTIFDRMKTVYCHNDKCNQNITVHKAKAMQSRVR